MCITVEHLFPDTEFRPTSSPDGLQLCFGDVSGTIATNNNLELPYNSHNNTRGKFTEPNYQARNWFLPKHFTQWTVELVKDADL